MKVLILAFGGNRNGVVLDDARYLLDERNGEVQVVTAMPRRFVALDPRASVIDLEEGESRLVVNRLERFVLVRIPRMISGVMVKVRGGTRPARLLVGLTWTLHVRGWRRLYMRLLRPLFMIKIARGTVFSLVERENFDLVVVGDAVSVPVAWQLARKHPEMQISFSVERVASPPAGAVA